MSRAWPSLDAVPTSLWVGGVAAGTVVLFLFAVQLLGAATEAAEPTLRGLLTRLVVDGSSALGLSWLASYVLANGSVVAALALSLFDAGLLTAESLFLMVFGSRLGGAAIVLFIGALDYFQKDRYSLQEAVSMGVLTFLLTHSIYVPALAVGYFAFPSLAGPALEVTGEWTVALRPLAVFDPVVGAVTAVLGPLPTFGLAVALLFGSLRLFDRVLENVDTSALRDHVFSRFRRTWLSFAFGVLITTVTTSVAFSLGVIVPLYNRGYVERDELIPYVLGSNLGTLFDTLVVAVVLETAVGTATVLLVLGIATLVTLVALVFHRQYARAISAVDDRVLADRRVFAAFLVALAATPVLLLAVPLVLA